MNDNFDEPKLSKFKLSSLIVSPIPKKVLSFSNNDNLRAATKPDQFLSSQNINNPEDSSNIQKFILHKNSAFRYFNKAMNSSLLYRKKMII